jgi:hypothetical protein
MNQPIKTLAEDTAIATGALAQSTVVPRFIHRDDMEAEGYPAYLNQVEDFRD